MHRSARSLADAPVGLPRPVHPPPNSTDLRAVEIDASVSCSSCDAVCCRLTVVVQPEDGIAEHLTERMNGLRVMARDAEGWCVALDSARMCCSIYDARPQVCRRFRMGGPYCCAVREDYARHAHRSIPSVLIQELS